MSPLILIRHAWPLIEPSRPSAEWELSAEGRGASRALARKLLPYSPVAIFSGPEPKQMQTAEELAIQFSVPFSVVAGLAEHQRRSTQYASRDQFEDAIRRLFAEPHRIVYGEESGDGTYERFAEAVERALERHGEGTVATVSGGTAISLFVARRAGVEAFGLWKSLKTPMALVLDRTSWAIAEILTP